MQYSNTIILSYYNLQYLFTVYLNRHNSNISCISTSMFGYMEALLQILSSQRHLYISPTESYDFHKVYGGYHRIIQTESQNALEWEYEEYVTKNYILVRFCLLWSKLESVRRTKLHISACFKITTHRRQNNSERQAISILSKRVPAQTHIRVIFDSCPATYIQRVHDASPGHTDFSFLQQ